LRFFGPPASPESDLDQLNDNACENLFGIEIRGLREAIVVQSAKTLNFLLVAECGAQVCRMMGGRGGILI
jgi:hypothetical protein